MNSTDISGKFLSVIQANKGIIYKVANAYCRNSEDRKDLIQEVIIQLWLSFNKYDETFKLTTWIYRIALNVCISFYRKESRRTEINQPLSDDTLSLHEETTGGESEMAVAQLHLFIKELKEIDRAIIILYLEENSHQEIAEILGLTAKNVSTKVVRIKQQLKQKFSIIKS